MDEQVVENFIRRLSTGFGYRFPEFCYRCGRTFEPRLIAAIEREVINGKTIIETIKDIYYDPVNENYYYSRNPSNDKLALGPKDICCRMSIISPYVYPTGTIVSQVREKQIVGTTTRTQNEALDFFDFIEDPNERSELLIDEEHGDIRLYIEPGIPGFDLPIEWEEF
jgi:hypothetical protein